MTNLERYTAIVTSLNAGLVILGVIFMVLVVVAVFSSKKKVKDRCMTFGSVAAGVWFLFLIGSIIIHGYAEELRTPVHTEASMERFAPVPKASVDAETELKRLEAHTASKGKWQDAIGKPVIDTYEYKDGDIRGTHDVDGDGVGDFHIIYNKEGKPTAWRGLDEYGKPYG